MQFVSPVIVDAGLIVKLTVLPFCVATVIYFLNCWIAGHFIKPDWQKVLLWFTAVGCLGLFGEAFLDTAFNFVMGWPLWHYNVLPVHNGFISIYGPVVWGLFGLHVYWSSETIKRKWPKINRPWQLGLIMSVEALFIESAFNAVSLWLFGVLFFYYYPNDLWHFTSLLNLPFWFLGGIFIHRALSHFSKSPAFFIRLSIELAITLIII